MNRSIFFDSVRASLFGGIMKQPQVDGCNILLDEAAKRKDYDPRYTAYVLGTAFHETGTTMQPVRETFAKTDKAAIARLETAWKAGQLGQVKTPYWRDGWFGRGYVQLTHREGYVNAGKKLGLDLISNPSLALDPAIAARIIFRGMEEGWFTTHKLADHITPAKTDFVKARRIVNGNDRAVLIAGHADRFLTAILAAELAPQEPVRQPDDPGPREDKAPARKGWLAVLLSIIAALFRR